MAWKTWAVWFGVYDVNVIANFSYAKVLCYQPLGYQCCVVRVFSDPLFVTFGESARGCVKAWVSRQNFWLLIWNFGADTWPPYLPVRRTIRGKGLLLVHPVTALHPNKTENRPSCKMSLTVKISGLKPSSFTVETIFALYICLGNNTFLGLFQHLFWFTASDAIAYSKNHTATRHPATPLFV